MKHIITVLIALCSIPAIIAGYIFEALIVGFQTGQRHFCKDLLSTSESLKELQTRVELAKAEQKDQP